MTRTTRRALLRAGLLAPACLFPAHATAAVPSGGPVLVCVFLRGAADGLNIVVPHTDDEYYRLRPSIAVPRPGQRGGAIDLDGRFGLHPRLHRLRPAWEEGQLALVHAVGSPHPTRSHFEAQDYMETAAVGDRSATQGWLGRYFASLVPAGGVRAVAVSTRSPLALRGYTGAVIAPSLSDFGLTTAPELEPALSAGFRKLYEGDARLAERAALRALEDSGAVQRALRRGRKKARYPRGMRDFADVATLIKANLGLQVAWLDVGGWDTHRGQGSVEGGSLPSSLERLGGALSAFREDLGAHFERVLVLVMSEFGRTARENGTGGTDHGHGGVMLVMGGRVKGGRVLGTFPGLAADQLHDNRDVPVTTDFRDVLGEVCERHLQVRDASPLFPGYQIEMSRRLGLLAH